MTITRFTTMLALHRKGHSHVEIGCRMAMSAEMVRYWLRDRKTLRAAKLAIWEALVREGKR